jgi:hypothetical protein
MKTIELMNVFKHFNYKAFVHRLKGYEIGFGKLLSLNLQCASDAQASKHSFGGLGRDGLTTNFMVQKTYRN